MFVIIGFATVFVIKGKTDNYFVAGRSLPLWVVTMTLASQVRRSLCFEFYNTKRLLVIFINVRLTCGHKLYHISL